LPTRGRQDPRESSSSFLGRQDLERFIVVQVLQQALDRTLNQVLVLCIHRPKHAPQNPATLGSPRGYGLTLKSPEPCSDLVVQGTVKFWRDDDGWGVIASPAVPGDVWAHFSAIEAAGYRDLALDDPVEFNFQPAEQDGYHFLATRVRKLQQGRSTAGRLPDSI
jgi:CspA family cold shock protein